MVITSNLRNEQILGNEGDQKQIIQYLSEIRRQAIINDVNELKLSDLIQSNYIHKNLFQEVIGLFKESMTKIYHFELIDPNRYLIMIPENNVGGFYGIPEGGFDHYQSIGKTTLLNRNIIKSDFLLTIELARNYLHDSIHNYTFKSFVWNREKKVVSRYQYGINFRTIEGVSYSSPNLSTKSPIGINLNVLMDGLTQYYISIFLRKKLHTREPIRHYLEFAVFEELFYANLIQGYSEPIQYYNDILLPTVRFLEYWGHDFLIPEIMYAMLSGNNLKLKDYFSSKLNRADAWECLFKQPLFTEQDASLS